MDSFAVFTYNAIFDPHVPRWGEVLKWRDELGIASNRLYYQDSEKHYCKEFSEQVTEFVMRFEDKIVGAHVIHATKLKPRTSHTCLSETSS